MVDMVLVACKLPHGIILEVDKQQMELKGSMQAGRSQTSFFMSSSQGVGLTRIPQDFWEAWLQNHQEFAPVKKGLIFAAGKKKKVLDEAREKEKLLHGLEPIDPARMPQALEQIRAGQAS